MANAIATGSNGPGEGHWDVFLDNTLSQCLSPFRCITFMLWGGEDPAMTKILSRGDYKYCQPTNSIEIIISSGCMERFTRQRLSLHKNNAPEI